MNLNKLENLITFELENNRSIIKIGNTVIESITVPGIAGLRTCDVSSNFKTLDSISIVGFVNKGQNQEGNMRQVINTGIAEIISTKRIEMYTAGNQTLKLTLIGTI